VINLITRISVIGIMVITAALVILLSAFNGIEKMIEALYSEYDTDITISLEKGKTFSEDRLDISLISDLEGVDNITRAMEEVVILKHEKKWVNANLVGVDSSFLAITNMKNHMVDGEPFIEKGGGVFALMGATLLDKLEGYIPENVGHESLICYAPKSDMKIRSGKSPFNASQIKVAGRFNYNKEVNQEAFIVPLSYAREILQKPKSLSAIYVDVSPEYDNGVIQERLRSIVGDDFVVKTSLEKNELIFKTSKTERIIVLVILLFIFILAAFTLVASLTMLFVEKRKDLDTLRSFGADRNLIFKVFFLEGIMISGKGILFGLILGYTICLVQLNFGLLVMPNSGGEAFPIALNLMDGLMIFGLVSLLSVLFSYLPVLYLVRSNLKQK
jgi:lipoprotein-releasing system permease protein